MKHLVGITTLAAALVLGTAPAWATRTQTHVKAESPQYGQKAIGMLGRGALNCVTCFVDPLVQTVNETKAGPPFIGTLTGLAKGLGCGVLRLGSGAVDIVTFWVPGFNGLPVSDSYENCLNVGAAPTGSATVAVPAESWESPAMSEPAQGEPVQAEPQKKYYKK